MYRKGEKVFLSIYKFRLLSEISMFLKSSLYIRISLNTCIRSYNSLPKILKDIVASSIKKNWLLFVTKKLIKQRVFNCPSLCTIPQKEKKYIKLLLQLEVDDGVISLPLYCFLFQNNSVYLLLIFICLFVSFTLPTLKSHFTNFSMSKNSH